MLERRKRLLLAFSTAALAIAILEVISFSLIQFNIVPVKNHSSQRTRPLQDFGWGQLTPHPYFGFTYTRGELPTQNAIRRLLSERMNSSNERPFVVGVFGGSVAEQFGNTQAKYLQSSLKKILTEHGVASVRVLNLAMGAHKQPQAFHIAMLYFDYLDMLINIEGWNEVMPRSYHQTTIPFDHLVADMLPAFTEFLFRYNQKNLENIGLALAIRKVERWMDHVLLAPPLSYSQTLRLLRHFSHLGTQALLHSMPTQTSAYSLPTETSPEGKQYSPEMLQERIERWAKYSRSQHVLAKDREKYSFTFIQPNHHVLDSKPLSPEEESRIDPILKDYATSAYERLSEQALMMQEEGFQVHSLEKIFTDVPDTLFVDIAHLNDRGNEIMAQEISKIIATHVKHKKNISE